MSNRLKKEKSPYLLQHAENPVDWYPWGEEAFQVATREDKPVFLSIGYSTCHWCHVMEKESFENREIADLMNRSFINIKVDREERPDIDKFYMSVCQVLTGSGGWPLTILLMPDKKPFFASTYIPPENRHDRMGMKDLIAAIIDLWRTDREKVIKSTDDILAYLQEQDTKKIRVQTREDVFSKAFLQLRTNYDKINGGFSSRPKFPTPHNLLFLMRYYKSYNDNEALEMVERTLKKMSTGGIFDQVGFGFHRYSTDAVWHLPHFEKMLYDQGMLSIAYTEAFQITGKDEYREMVEKTLAYVLRDLTSSEGGFYSAEDADSEGEEGKFYVFSIRELAEILFPEEMEFIKSKFELTDQGNFKEEATGQLTGSNIFHLSEGLSSANKIVWETIRSKIYSYREKRIHPLKDDKILTDWNGLMIAALAKAGRACEESGYISAAERAADFILSNMFEENILYHRWREGERAVTGNLDDHAFLIWGLLELYEATFNSSYLIKALKMTDTVLELFKDRRRGGFYFTSEEASELHLRSRDLYDGAYPSGNSVMFYNLNRLERYTGDPRFSKEIKSHLRGFSTEIHKTPLIYTFYLTALDLNFHPGFDIVFFSDSDKTLTPFKKIVNEQYLPNTIQLSINLNKTELLKTIPWLQNYLKGETDPEIYVCHERKCELPINKIEVLKQVLNKKQ